MAFKLFEHQNMALPIMKEMESRGKGGFLADEMGLGKTITMITYLMSNKIPKKTDLIVCPLSLMKQWKKEIKRVYKGNNKSKPIIMFFHGPNRIENMKCYKEKYQIDYVITTYSVLAQFQLDKYKWGRVVLDESHYIRNGVGSGQVKCALGAYRVGERSKYNWCITGTPFNNRMTDIISQCKFIGTTPYNDPAWWKKELGGLSQYELDRWRNTFVLRRTKEKLLVPPNYHDIEITPTICETKLVDTMRRKAQHKFEKWKMTNGFERIKLQGEILGLIQKLRIISNSYYCGEEKKHQIPKILVENAKVQVMLETLDNILFSSSSNSVVIFSQFTSYLDLFGEVVKEILPGVNIFKFNGKMNHKERDNVIQQFTNSTTPSVLLISLLAGGCGLNLMPCSTVFLSEPYYNPFAEKQAEERVHRLGQKNQVNVYRFFMKNSVETWVNRLKQKKLLLASSLDLVCKNETIPTDFKFEDLSDLFQDLVMFQNEDKSSKKKQDKREKCKKSKKREKKHKNKSEKIGLDCSICLEVCRFEGTKNLVCGHLYHDECIQEWSNINNTCPTCRKPIQYIY